MSNNEKADYVKIFVFKHYLTIYILFCGVWFANSSFTRKIFNKIISVKRKYHYINILTF